MTINEGLWSPFEIIFGSFCILPPCLGISSIFFKWKIQNHSKFLCWFQASIHTLKCSMEKGRFASASVSMLSHFSNMEFQVWGLTEMVSIIMRMLIIWENTPIISIRAAPWIFLWEIKDFNFQSMKIGAWSLRIARTSLFGAFGSWAAMPTTEIKIC